MDFSFVPIRGKAELWNPNIYIEDIGVKLYGEGTIKCDKKFNRDEARGAAGIEMSTEVRGMFDFIDMEPVWRYSVNKDKERVIDFLIKSNF